MGKKRRRWDTFDQGSRNPTGYLARAAQAFRRLFIQTWGADALLCADGEPPRRSAKRMATLSHRNLIGLRLRMLQRFVLITRGYLLRYRPT